jgi:uncharacterized protein (TIGR01319 family)
MCIDVGSTFTKAALVDVDGGALLATASVPTTAATDVMEGIDRCRATLGAGDDVPALACSSAGGGLRLAVVGYERAISVEAGRRVGLCAGARTAHVASGPLGEDELAGLRASRPDVVLLAGGTDGGNAEILLHNAAALARAQLAVPVVAAGNVEVLDEVVAVLEAAGVTVYPSANVLPVIGRLDPLPARERIREVFIRHVIGGKGLSVRDDFRSLVRAATPDAVLVGVELLADGTSDAAGVGDVLVVDVGGATTDVYSVVAPRGEDAALHREVVEVLWRSRTVEGDLGVRWNAPGILDAALTERLLSAQQAAALRPAALRRAAEPAYVAGSDQERETDVRLAELAVTVALRRHGRGGKDLREVMLVVGSGGVLRNAGEAIRARVLRPAVRDFGGGWPVPEHARTVVDASYVLAAAGLLAEQYPQAAAGLLRSALLGSAWTA